MGVEHLPLGGQLHAPGRPNKQRRAEIGLELPDGPAYGRLGDEKLVRGRGNPAALRDVVKDFIVLKVNVHITSGYIARINIITGYIIPRPAGDVNGAGENLLCKTFPL